MTEYVIYFQECYSPERIGNPEGLFENGKEEVKSKSILLYCIMVCVLCTV
jgi:hypothetical protein